MVMAWWVFKYWMVNSPMKHWMIKEVWLMEKWREKSQRSCATKIRQLWTGENTSFSTGAHSKTATATHSTFTAVTNTSEILASKVSGNASMKPTTITMRKWYLSLKTYTFCVTPTFGRISQRYLVPLTIGNPSLFYASILPLQNKNLSHDAMNTYLPLQPSGPATLACKATAQFSKAYAII